MKREDAFEKAGEAYLSQKAKGYSPFLGGSLKEVYTPEDTANIDYSRDIGDPEQYPYTRGIFANMYRGRLWTMRQLSGFGTPEDTRQRMRYLAEQGTTGLSFVVDEVTMSSIDGDHPLAEGEVGVTGVPLYSLKDMETLLEGIPIERLSTNIIMCGCATPAVMCQYIAVAQKRGLDISRLRGVIQNSPFHHHWCSSLAGSRYIDVFLKTAGDVIEYCAKNMPLWNPLNININSVQPMRLPAGELLGLACAMVSTHLREALGRGLDIDEVAPKISLFMTVGVELFPEVAKFRAARRLWAKLIRERFSAKKPGSWKVRIAALSAGYSLYPQEPLNNIARLTTQALAAILGGVQSINVVCYDEPIALPTEESQRLSLRIQQILAHEAGAGDVADPLGGSYYIEYLTSKLEEEANRFLEKIEGMGGLERAEANEWVRQRLEDAFLQSHQRIERGEQIIVGVNAFAIPSEQDRVIPVHRIPPEAASKQVESLKELRQTRDNERVRQCIAKLRGRAERRDRENLMPYILEAVKAYATIGEITGTIYQAYGYPYDTMGMIESPF